MKNHMTNLKNKTRKFIEEIDVQQVLVFGTTAATIVLGAKIYAHRIGSGSEPHDVYLPPEAWDIVQDKGRIRSKNGKKHFRIVPPVTTD